MPLIPGATAISYELQPEDVGFNIFCRVRGTNAAGFDIGQSNTVGPVVSSAVLPAISIAPEVTVAVDGASVTCDTGTWTGTEPITYGYQWYSDEALDVAIPGATSATYVIDGGVIVEAGPFAYLGDAEGQGADSIVTSAIDTTGASLLIVATADYPGSNTVSDSKGNTWTTAVLGGNARLHYSYPTTVGTGHTITLSNVTPPIYSAACFIAFSGGAAGSFDTEMHNLGSGTSATGGSITPSQNGSLVISVIAIKDAGGGSSTVGSGLTKICDIPYSAAYGLTVGYLVQATAAAIDPVWNIPGTNDWTGHNVAFTPTATITRSM